MTPSALAQLEETTSHLKSLSGKIDTLDRNVRVLIYEKNRYADALRAILQLANAPGDCEVFGVVDMLRGKIDRIALEAEKALE